MLTKRVILSLASFILSCKLSHACIDCNGTLNNATLSGNTYISSLTVTEAVLISSNGFFGPGNLLTSLPSGATAYVRNSNNLVSGTSFYVSSGSVEINLNVGGKVSASSGTFARIFSTGNVTAASLDIGGVITASSATFSDFTSTGNVRANFFFGDGSSIKNVPTEYGIIIGTIGATGGKVDIRTNDETGFNTAISSLGSSGGTVFVRNGNYVFANTFSVPTGFDFIFESSATISASAISVQALNVSGRLFGANFRITRSSNVTPFLKMLYGGRMYNTTVSSISLATDSGLADSFHIKNTSDVIISGMYLPSIYITSSGGTIGNIFTIVASTNILFENFYAPNNHTANGSNAGIAWFDITGGTNIEVRNMQLSHAFKFCNITSAAGNMLDGVYFHNITFNASASNGTLQNVNGFFFVNGAVSISTGIVLSDIRMSVDGSDTDSIVSVLGTAQGILVENFKVNSKNASSWVFSNIQSATIFGTIFKDNIVSNMASFLTDSGTFTKSASIGNFLNGIEQ